MVSQKRHLIFFPLTQNHVQNWPMLRKKKLGKLTLLQEVLDNEKTPALILTVSLFMEEKKRQSINMPSCFMKAL